MSDPPSEHAGTLPAEFVVDQLYQAFRRRDLQALGALLDPQVQVDWNGATGAVCWRGPTEVLSALARSVKESGGTALVSPIASYAGPDTSVVVVHQETGRWNRVASERTASVIFELVDGLVTRVTRIPLAADDRPPDGIRSR